MNILEILGIRKASMETPSTSTTDIPEQGNTPSTTDAPTVATSPPEGTSTDAAVTVAL